MGKIYQRADEVLVWLGAADHDGTTEAEPLDYRAYRPCS